MPGGSAAPSGTGISRTRFVCLGKVGGFHVKSVDSQGQDFGILCEKNFLLYVLGHCSEAQGFHQRAIFVGLLYRGICCSGFEFNFRTSKCDRDRNLRSR